MQCWFLQGQRQTSSQNTGTIFKHIDALWSKHTIKISFKRYLVKSKSSLLHSQHRNWSQLQLQTTHLKQGEHTVNVSIKYTPVQSCPTRLFVFCQEIYAFGLSQPVQHTFFATRWSEMYDVSTKGILDSGSIVAVRRQKGLDLPFASSGDYRNDIQSMLQRSTLWSAVWQERAHLHFCSCSSPQGERPLKRTKALRCRAQGRALQDLESHRPKSSFLELPSESLVLLCLALHPDKDQKEICFQKSYFTIFCNK